MATLLHRKKGEQFFDADGDPLAGGKLYYDEAGTTDDQATYSDSAGTTPNTNPVVLDSAGRLTVPIYFGDSDSFSDYKETLTTSADVTVSPWPFDNIPAATPAAAAAAFAPPLFPWTQVTSGASPVALTAADAGKAYEADTTSGSIEFDLPSAASVGDGKGFVFKKLIAANSMIIDPSGTETIDNSSTSLTITRQYQVIGIFSNGAEWYKAFEYLDSIGVDRLASTFINGLSAATAAADTDELLLQLAAGGAYRKITPPSLSDYNFIESGTVTAAATKDFTIPAGYDELEFLLLNWLPATDNVNLQIRFSQAAAFLAGASDYDWGVHIFDARASDGADSQIFLNNTWGNAAAEFGQVQVRLFRPLASSFRKSVLFQGQHHSTSAEPIVFHGGGALIANNNAIDGIRFMFSSGNIASGYYAVFGRKYS